MPGMASLVAATEAPPGTEEPSRSSGGDVGDVGGGGGVGGASVATTTTTTTTTRRDDRALSPPVAELFFPRPSSTAAVSVVPAPSPSVGVGGRRPRFESLLLWDEGGPSPSPSASDRRRSVVAGPPGPPRPLPRLNLGRGGPLRPSRLLPSLLRPEEEEEEEEEDAAIRSFLDGGSSSDDGAMLRAARALCDAAVSASSDVESLRGFLLEEEYGQEHGEERRRRRPGGDGRTAAAEAAALSERARLALRLLLPTSKDGEGEELEDLDRRRRRRRSRRRCSHLSAAQLLLSELDAALESYAPPLPSLDVSSSSSSPSSSMPRAGKWRIRDLLRNETVRSILGMRLSLVLHVLVGPLNGVCLRNLVWHGYVSPTGLEYSGWTYLLFLVVGLGLPPHRRRGSAAAAVAEEKVARDDEKRGRSGAAHALPSPTSPTDEKGEGRRRGGRAAARRSLEPWIPSCEDVEDLLRRQPRSSPFVPPCMRPAFLEATDLCREECVAAAVAAEDGVGDESRDDDGSDARLWRALGLLYVVLERGLRTLYGKTNPGLPRDPTLAYKNVLHVTVSTMLRSTATGGDDDQGSDGDDDDLGGARTRRPDDDNDGNGNGNGSKGDDARRHLPNGLLPYLGGGPTGALYDEFVWLGLPDASGPLSSSSSSEMSSSNSEPPPCRNELVHGTLSLDDVSPAVVSRLVRLVVGLTALTTMKKRGKDEATTTSMTSSSAADGERDDRVRRCLDWVTSYRPVRHPTCQVWALFRSVLRGNDEENNDDGKSRPPPTSVVDAALPVATTTTTPRRRRAAIAATARKDPSAPSPATEAVEVDYCPVCGFPPEYCWYSPRVIECLERRLDFASSSFRSARVVADELLARLATAQEGGDDALANVETALGARLGAARVEVLSAVGIATSSTAAAADVDDDDGDPWSVLDGPPLRRSCPELELSKLWSIREAAHRCREADASVRRRLLIVLAAAARGESRIRVGSKKQPIVVVVRRLAASHRAIELVLAMAFQQHLAARADSHILSAYLSVMANTLGNLAERGRLRHCLAVACGLVGGGGECVASDSSDAADLAVRERLTEVLPRSDRGKFDLDFPRYLRHAMEGKDVDGRSGIVKNRFALGNAARADPSSSDVGDDDDDGRVSAGAAWDSLRRWQQMSSFD